ncbi:MAG: hypothetical protein GX235_05540 [Clostridiales bacterium]|nr:hypothetical protein [Clostridiales bacterium]
MQPGVVQADGSIASRTVTSAQAIRPACQLDLKSVLCASAFENGKDSVGVGNGLSGAMASAIYKLTVIDKNMTTPTLQLSESTNGTGESSFDYSGVQTGDKRYLSCLFPATKVQLATLLRLYWITER